MINFFKRLFGNTTKKTSFDEADKLTMQLSVTYVFFQTEQMKGSGKSPTKAEYENTYFETMNKLVGLDLNQKHLFMMASMEPEGSFKESPLITFIKKIDNSIYVFGEISNSTENEIQIFDIDKSYKPIRIYIANIQFNKDYEAEASRLKKGDKVQFQIKIADNLSWANYSSAARMRPNSDIDSVLNAVHKEENMTIIEHGGEVRIAITGKLIQKLEQ